jgi:hypothetical protein
MDELREISSECTAKLSKEVLIEMLCHNSCAQCPALELCNNTSGACKEIISLYLDQEPTVIKEVTV